MNYLLKLIYLSSLFYLSTLGAMQRDIRETILPPYALKHWIKEVIQYHYQLTTHDYHRYVAPEYKVQHNHSVWNFSAWSHNLFKIKEKAQSISIEFNHIVVENNHIAVSYVIYLINNNHRLQTIKMISLFLVKEGKLISADELALSG